MDLPPIELPSTAPAPVPVESSATVAHVAAPSRFDRVLERLGVEIDRGEALVDEVVHGHAARLDAAELIALQVGIYRYSEAVDLAAKFVDRAGSAVRTTLQGSGG